ncbi:hypothetical protein T05_875 [Trichinella murrelli]|uniref:Uncharacterized protein n=1 Tax=Trichinella murrelli TaxID=144512 RepID=A0A0V0SRJ1_9BILA|nr:hypothetical protein T05_11039 [Trichinella murrelli]KRX30727.1 hypothetical protein T05_875 [Trichinella murrelli]
MHSIPPPKYQIQLTSYSWTVLKSGIIVDHEEQPNFPSVIAQ